MKVYFIAVITFLFFAFNVQAQETVYSGKLLSVTDSSILAQAHVINLTAKRGVTTNSQGDFTLAALPTDTVFISILGYNQLTIEAQALVKTIYLTERNYELELYNVMPYKTYAEFKEAFAKLNLPDTTLKISKSIYVNKEELVALSKFQGGIAFEGVVSGILASFNKHLKDKAHYEMLLKRDEYEAVLATKFNPELVERITELNDRATLEDFIEYCDFSKSFIEYSSNYAIIDRVFECYDEYLSLSLASK